MCFYVRLCCALLRNLALRLSSDLGDWLALAKRRLLYRLWSCVSNYDDVGPDDPTLEDLLCDQSDLGAGLEGNCWFLDSDRKTAQELVMTGGEGCFLIRKSARYPLTLTVMHENRPFNIPLRRRGDGRIGMGTRKTNERTFESIEDLINFYKREELILFSGGEKAGEVTLLSPPSKAEILRKCQENCHHVHVPQ